MLDKMREEAECCATIAIIYAEPSSDVHITEPKYTRQDVVTIISGNIEAWLGLSAVHAYIFIEQLYDALLDARLISNGLVELVVGRLRRRIVSSAAGRRYFGANKTTAGGRSNGKKRPMAPESGTELLSILTKWRVKISHMFAHLIHANFWRSLLRRRVQRQQQRQRDGGHRQRTKQTATQQQQRRR